MMATSNRPTPYLIHDGELAVRHRVQPERDHLVGAASLGVLLKGRTEGSDCRGRLRICGLLSRNLRHHHLGKGPPSIGASEL